MNRRDFVKVLGVGVATATLPAVTISYVYTVACACGLREWVGSCDKAKKIVFNHVAGSVFDEYPGTHRNLCVWSEHKTDKWLDEFYKIACRWMMRCTCGFRTGKMTWIEANKSYWNHLGHCQLGDLGSCAIYGSAADYIKYDSEFYERTRGVY